MKWVLVLGLKMVGNSLGFWVMFGGNEVALCFVGKGGAEG